MNQSAVSCSDMNAYWNNATNPPDQSALNVALLPALLAYAVVGAIASVFNIVCILTFITKKELREKYLFFAVLAFANLINTFFMFLAGTLRRHLIFTNQFMQLRSTFECLLQPGPHLQLPGGQLPALVLLVIDIERLIAVYRPLFYKAYFTDQTRIYVVYGCFGAVFISQLFGYLSSYMNRDLCSTAFCAVMSAYGLSYSNYNSTIVILFPIIALILNVFTYIGAQRLGAHANMKKELKLIFVTLVITCVAVLLIVFPNVVLFGAYNKLITIASANLAYLYVFFCCNSAINLFVYIFLKRDFRNHLLMSISFGALRSYLTDVNEITRTRPSRIRKVMPSNGSTVPIRSISSMPNIIE